MSLMDQIRMDVANITGDVAGFATPIRFETPSGQISIIPGTRTNHHFGINPTNGAPINSRTASISVSELALTAAAYPFRNSEGKVSLKDHKVSYADSSGVTRSYKIREWYPDETVGLIVCILGDFK